MAVTIKSPSQSLAAEVMPAGGWRAGTWPWVLQRLSAIGLLFLLGAHFWVGHFADPSAQITFASVQMRLRSVLFIGTDGLLLALALFHGLNGVRNVLFDLRLSPRVAAVAARALAAIGVAFFIYGLLGLRAFLQ